MLRSPADMQMILAHPPSAPYGARRVWAEPSCSELPSLTNLTLQSASLSPTGDAIVGSGSSGGLVF